MNQKDYTNSHKYFQKLLPYLPTEAGFYLGEQYYYGLGVQANTDKAIRYYTIAANEGEPVSQQKLGLYFFRNELDIRDESLAYHWNKTASNNPDAVDCDDAGECTYNLAICYLKGIGTNKNKDLGEIWMSMSAILDFGKAQDYIEQKYNIQLDGETDEEEQANQKKLLNHFYHLILPKLQNDLSMEASIVKCLYHFQNLSFTSFLTEAQQLFTNSTISNEGKKNIGELLIAYYRTYKNDKFNAELIEEELAKLTKIDDLNYRYWILQQYIICLSKFL